MSSRWSSQEDVELQGLSNVHVDEHDQEESRKPRGSLKVRNPAGPAIGISDARSYSMREELQFMIRNTTCGKIIGFVISVASFISIILYVVTSYMEEEAADNDDPLKWIDFMFDVLFLIDYVFFLYLADDRLAHILRPTSMADLLSVMPVFSMFFSDLKVLAIFRFFRCIRILKLYRLHVNFGDVSSQTHRQIVVLAFTTLAFLFVSAGFIHGTDVLADGGQFAGVEGQLNFHEAFYFLVVTITTVGYGDITPDTDLSRMLMVFIILCGFSILPRQVAMLNEVVRRHSRFHRQFKPHNRTWRHIVVVGPPTPTGISADSIRSIVTGFMHQDRGDIKMHVVILSPFEPAPEIMALLQHRQYELRLTYVKGSVMETSALERARAGEAQAFFVLVNKYDSVELMHEEDMEAILATLAIKRTHNSMRVIVELNSEASKSWLEAYHLPQVQAICLEELRNGLLAHSCLYPGLSTLLMNVVKIHDVEQPNDDLNQTNLQPEWVEQYLWGASQQLYEVDISCCAGLPFCLAVGFIMKHFKLLLIAVQEKATRNVWRNPGNLYIIRKGDMGYVLSHNRLSRTTLDDSPLLSAKGLQGDLARLRLQTAQARQQSIQQVTKDKDVLSTPDLGSRHTSSLYIPSAEGNPLNSPTSNPGQIPLELSPKVTVGSPERDPSARIVNPCQDQQPAHQSPLLLPVQATPQPHPSPRSSFSLSAVRHDLPPEMASAHQQKHVELVGHIVVFGSVHGSRSFIEPLRVKQSRYEDMSKLRPIVIVSPESDIDEINAVLAPYYFVFHITGSPLDRKVMTHAAVSQAERVVILRDSSMSQRFGRLQHSAGMNQADYLPVIDAENAFCYRQVLEECGAKQDLPIIELIHIPNMRFLSMNELKCPHDEQYLRWPLYTAGQVVSTSTFNALFTHIFFFPGMLEMFSALAHRSRIPETRIYQVQDSGFICVPVPSSFHSLTYSTFFSHCLELHEAICLGLYRVASDEPYHPFVFTNPHPDELVVEADMAFLLAPPGFSLAKQEGPAPKKREGRRQESDDATGSAGKPDSDTTNGTVGTADSPWTSDLAI